MSDNVNDELLENLLATGIASKSMMRNAMREYARAAVDRGYVLGDPMPVDPMAATFTVKIECNGTTLISRDFSEYDA